MKRYYIKRESETEREGIVRITHWTGERWDAGRDTEVEVFIGHKRAKAAVARLVNSGWVLPSDKITIVEA